MTNEERDKWLEDCLADGPEPGLQANRRTDKELAELGASDQMHEWCLEHVELQLPKPYYQHAGIVIYHGNCLDLLPILPCVDILVTDPPYGCSKSDWDTHFPQSWYALSKANTVVIITGSEGLRDSIPLVGADFVDVIAGHNLNGMTRGPIGFGNWIAAVVARGKPSQGPNCFDFIVKGKMPNHPSPKPLSYMNKLLNRLASTGCLILDPFMGSGTTLVAAKQLGFRAIGVEIEERYCNTAVARLSQEMLPIFGE